MKAQVAFLVVLLLLVGIFNEAECLKFKNKRSVKGSITIGGAPAKDKSGSVVCKSEATYVEGIDNYYDKSATAKKSFKTDSKGKFSVSLELVDDIKKGWRPYTLTINCDIKVGKKVVRSYSYTGPSIDAGTIAL